MNEKLYAFDKIIEAAKKLAEAEKFFCFSTKEQYEKALKDYNNACIVYKNLNKVVK